MLQQGCSPVLHGSALLGALLGRIGGIPTSPCGDSPSPAKKLLLSVKVGQGMTGLEGWWVFL